ncbi:hypothetical protein [Pedobacter sp. JCM 36344]|uniref:hypothetical protein n=1 Tax=Pedobacter sp. JCM 36344 TaxID=3374280 RepID=UPI00397CAF49
MKKVFTLLHFCLLATGASLFMSCEKEKLADVLSKEQFDNVAISLATKTEIGTGSTFTLTGGELTVPVTVDFSTATTRAFTVQLTANADTVAQLVTAGTLATGTVPISTGSFSIPTVLNVPIGVTKTTFNLVVSRSFLEVNYGKTVALALKMTSPAKGNTIAQGKSVGIITIKTAEAIAADAVHYIGFAASTLLVPDNNNFVLGSQDLTITLPISLSGIAGPTFTVDVTKDAAASQALITSGGVTNAAILPSDRFAVGIGKVTFDLSKNTTSIVLSTNFSQLMALTDKKWLLGLTLTNPTKYQTSATKKSIVVIIDGNNLSRPYIGNETTLVRPYTGTPFVISGTIDQASELIPAAIYDLGGEGVAFHDNGGKDGATGFRPNDQVDIANNIPRVAVGWTGDGEWLTYTVNVEADGTYELNSIIGSAGDEGRYTIFFDGVAITPLLSAKKTPGAYGDQQPNYTTVSLKKGRHIFKFFMNRATYDVKGWIFTRKS